MKVGTIKNHKTSMNLLGWKEITTSRQKKNGTRIFELPIKKHGQYIKVGSFRSGYVRRMNGGYTPYQLNKCENYDHFYKNYEYRGDGTHKWTGKYNKHVCRRRLLIDNEVDRIEYLIAYCLKNYYINQANMIENGKFVSKWKHEWKLELKEREYEKTIRELHEEIDRISEEKDNMERQWKGSQGALQNLSVVVNNERYKII